MKLGLNDVKESLQDFQEGTPVGLGSREIQNIGALVAEKLGYKNGQDLKLIIQSLGGEIKFQTVQDWVADSDEIIVNGPRNFQIFLSNFSGPLRDRFTVAHELGHYILHSNFGEKPLRVRRHGKNPLETEANAFAAGFLMPENDFIEIAKTFENNCEQIASHFRVSRAAAAIRLKSLGLSKDAT